MNTIICKQLEKYKDKNGKIIGYRLVDQAGVQTQMKSEDLKNQIKAGTLKVVNLTLTKDGRLVDGAEQQIQKDPANCLENVSDMIKAIKTMNVASLQKDDLKILVKILSDKLKEAKRHAYKCSAFGINLDFNVPDFAIVSKTQELVDKYLCKNEYMPEEEDCLLIGVILRPDQKETNIIGVYDREVGEIVCNSVQNLMICWMMKNGLYGLNPEQTEEDVLSKVYSKEWLKQLKTDNWGLNSSVFKIVLLKK